MVKDMASAVIKGNNNVKIIDTSIGKWTLQKLAQEIRDFDPDTTIILLNNDTLELSISVADICKNISTSKVIAVSFCLDAVRETILNRGKSFDNAMGWEQAVKTVYF